MGAFFVYFQFMKLGLLIFLSLLFLTSCLEVNTDGKDDKPVDNEEKSVVKQSVLGDEAVKVFKDSFDSCSISIFNTYNINLEVYVYDFEKALISDGFLADNSVEAYQNLLVELKQGYVLNPVKVTSGYSNFLNLIKYSDQVMFCWNDYYESYVKQPHKIYVGELLVYIKSDINSNNITYNMVPFFEVAVKSCKSVKEIGVSGKFMLFCWMLTNMMYQNQGPTKVKMEQLPKSSMPDEESFFRSEY